MGLIDEKECLFLIIDVQQKLLNAVFNKPLVERCTSILSQASQILDIPVVVTEQYPKGLGYTIETVQNFLSENAKTFEKTSFSALENDEIKKAVISAGKKQIIIFGIETHICVNQTVFALIEEGFEVFVVSDACGSRDETEHRAGLTRMKSHGAQIVTTEIVLFELLKSAKHPHFKEIQNLIK